MYNYLKQLRPSAIAFTLIFLQSALFAQYHIQSPDMTVKGTISVNGESLQLSATKDLEPMFVVKNMLMQIGEKESKNIKVTNEKKSVSKSVFTPVVPTKFSSIVDEYNSLLLELNNGFSLEVRAYNSGLAYRFVSKLKGEYVVEKEQMSLVFPVETNTYFPKEDAFISHNERYYIQSPLNRVEVGSLCSLPILFEVGTRSVHFTESDLVDFPGMFLINEGNYQISAIHPNFVKQAIPAPSWPDRVELITDEANYIAKCSGERTFPWRVFSVANNQAELLTNTLVQQLATPSKLKKTSWIKPGKVAWDWYNANNVYDVDFDAGINNDTYKYYIDFASEYGLEYVILDEGWTKSTTNILESDSQIDVPELVKYGNERNVDLILWVLWKPLDNDLEKALALYKKWGVKGIKVDFMQRSDQYMVNYYERVARVAAANELLVDFHGAFKPSGLSTTYPNVISFEGVKGAENNKWSSDLTTNHNLTLPFIRMVAGPMDYTPGGMHNANAKNHSICFDRPMSNGTRAHQVAMYAVYESPLQMLCDSPTDYIQDDVTARFISRFPTTWDETKAIAGKVGEYVVIARRKGDTWYLGIMTDEAKTLEVPLSFLKEGSFTMDVFKDGKNANRMAEDYDTESKEVNAKTTLSLTIPIGGGYAAVITKK